MLPEQQYTAAMTQLRGEKVWERRGGFDCRNVRCFGDYVMNFSANSLYLYNKYSGNLEFESHIHLQCFVVGKNLENKQWHYYLYQFFSDEGACDVRSDYWYIKKTNLKDFSTQDIIIDNYKGEQWSTSMQATPDYKFIVIYKDDQSNHAYCTENFIYVLDIITLKVVSHFNPSNDYRFAYLNNSKLYLKVPLVSK